MSFKKQGLAFLIATGLVIGIGCISMSPASAQSPVVHQTSVTGVKYVAEGSKLDVKRAGKYVKLRIPGKTSLNATFPDGRTAPYPLASVLNIWSDLAMMRAGTSFRLRFTGAGKALHLDKPEVGKNGSVRIRVPLKTWNAAAPSSLRLQNNAAETTRLRMSWDIVIESGSEITPCYYFAYNFTGTCVFQASTSNGRIADNFQIGMYGGLHATIAFCWEFPGTIPVPGKVSSSAGWYTTTGDIAQKPSDAYYPIATARLLSRRPGSCTSSSAPWLNLVDPNDAIPTGDTSPDGIPTTYMVDAFYVQLPQKMIESQKWYVNISTDIDLSTSIYYPLVIVSGAHL